jgi:hypothetical protein
MCDHYLEIWTLAVVMSTMKFNCRQVRGLLQLTFARSIGRTLPTEHTILDPAFTGEKDVKPGTGVSSRMHNSLI